MAASGLEIYIPGITPDASFPILRDDAILTNGSLALFDFAHSKNPVVGVPATNGAIPNLAYQEAIALTGAGTQSTWGLSFDAGNMVLTPGGDVSGYVERTPKGGLHVSLSQTASAGSSKGAGVRDLIGGSLQAYLYANWDHQYYISGWERITRIASGNGAPRYYIGNTAGVTANYISRADKVADYATGLLQNDSPALPQPVGNAYRSVRNSARTGAAPAAASNVQAYLLGAGQIGGYGALLANQHRSTVLYRAYLEDLTVSGRTFAQVDLIDKGLFDQAFGTGGRYSGDTFTADVA